jgi:dCMP deaminase
MKYLILLTHLESAKAYSKLSKAKRLKVGCLLVKDNRPISVGYNGTPVGYENVCEIKINNKMVTRPEVVHAEANSLMFAAKNGIATNGCDAIVTHSPCFECAKLLVQAGIKNVYFDKEYRIQESIDFLAENNVNIYKIGDLNE